MRFEASESLFFCNTLQFDEDTRIVATRLDPMARAQRRKTALTEDCHKAFEMVVGLVRPGT